jgi:glutamate/tyrosine decarboxylase-like PLP-dependent enzyme
MSAETLQASRSSAALLNRAAALANEWLESLPTRPVHARAALAELRAALGGELTAKGEDASAVIDALAKRAEPGLIGSAGPRYFGFVIGGSLPVTVAADWLVSAWDQNPGLYATSPAMAVIEEVAASWLLSLFGLPAGSGVGFVTGGQAANFTCLAAARHEVLRRAGWNVEENGLHGAPRIHLVASAESHVTITTSLRLLGLGVRDLVSVPADGQGRMLPEALAAVLARCDGPTIVCAQAGNVNTGSFDPLEAIAGATSKHGAWLHIDGAFGLWAAAVPARRHLVAGLARADSWAVDAHKWLNVPYDSGIAIVKHGAAHRAAMTAGAAYLIQGAGAERDNFEWVPEFSRRSRGVPVYAALKFLGRDGVADMIELCCRLAALAAKRLGAADGVAILNDVVLNQVLVRFADSDDVTRAVVRRVQDDGTCWLSGTTWHGMAAMRISLVNWSTTEDDIELSAEAILKAFREETRKN